MHLLLWSVGPVQDFIATARRTLDLTYGSDLLSRVARAAAAAVPAEAELVLPSAKALERPGVPNKILVALRAGADPRRVGEAMGDAARNEVIEEARRVFDWVTSESPVIARELRRQDALEQLKDLLEITWASTPLTPGAFQAARRRVEHLLAATKAQRAFASPRAWAGDRPKSSLDGAREAVIDLRPKREGEGRSARADARRRLGMLEQEVLCGVGLLKRAAPRWDPDKQRIPSVSAQAAHAFLEAARVTPGAQEAWSAYLDALPQRPSPELRVGLPLIGKYDPHLLYPSRIHERHEDPADQRAAERALRTFLAQVGTPLVREPGTYYAILQADGDRMGAVLDQAESAEVLQQVGDLLVNFSGQVQAIVAALGGSLVYAGGDDVLAFLPVENAMDAAARLRALYTAEVTTPASALVKTTFRTTLSVGIAIVHHLEPLSEALEHARAAEKAAKDAGRNAWCIRRVARSGGELTVCAEWVDGDQPFGLFGELQQEFGPKTDAVERGSLSRGLPYDLREAADRLIGPDGNQHPRLSDTRALAQSETRRVLRQKTGTKGPLEDRLVDSVTDLASMRDLADRLILARALTASGGDR